MYENKLQIAFNVRISAIISKILRVIHTVAGLFNNIITFSMLDDIVFFINKKHREDLASNWTDVRPVYVYKDNVSMALKFTYRRKIALEI